MKDPSKWKPGRLVRDAATGAFKANRNAIYSGSHYIADLQTAVYVPLIQSHISGHVLDCGCGAVPFHQLYAERITRSTCIDWSTDPHVLDLLDQVVDLTGPLPFPDNTFDSALLTDVLAHVPEPVGLIKELARVLKPGSKLVLTTPYIYWICEYPHEYFHLTRFALQRACEQAGLAVELLEPYGGKADVLLDTLNKTWDAGMAHRLFKLVRWVAEGTGWAARDRAKTKETYPLGYCLVARKSA